jgi:hypothetical protein
MRLTERAEASRAASPGPGGGRVASPFGAAVALMIRPRHLPRPALAGALLIAVLLLTFGVIRLLPLFDADSTDEGVPLAVFAEFGELADKIYSAPADDPSKRTLVATLEHAPGWGINPATTTHEGRAVYLLAPVVGGGRDTPAEVWTLDLKSGALTRIADDADLLIQPIINRDGSILYRRSNGQRQEIVRTEAGTGTRKTTYTEETAFGIFPVGEDADGNLVIARLSAGGTDLARVRDGVSAVVVHASDHLARGWQMAPDGKSLAYLAPEIRGERVVYRTHVVSLPDGKARTLAETLATSDHFNPLWTPTGDALAVGLDARGGPGAITLLRDGDARSLNAPPRGFDVPLSWSDGGTYLAVRSFDGNSATDPGNESTVVLGPDGARYLITAPGDVIFIGWVTGA